MIIFQVVSTKPLDIRYFTQCPRHQLHIAMEDAYALLPSDVVDILPPPEMTQIGSRIFYKFEMS